MNARDEKGFSPLHLAMDARNMPVILELLEVPGVDVNIPNLEKVGA